MGVETWGQLAAYPAIHLLPTGRLVGTGANRAQQVTIGGLTVTSQAVEAAETVSSSFTSDPDIDGLVGLGFDSLNTVSPTKQPTWFDNIKSSLDSPLFTADLKHNARK
jgi:hypothetical protein